MTYKLTRTDSILRLSDNAFIPKDEGNSDYQAYLLWLSEGNTPEEADPIPEKSYAELRRAEYPPIEDYIDGIVKGDTEQVQAYIDACLAVKAKYPKPLIEESADEISS
jgi:hypothetical protein